MHFVRETQSLKMFLKILKNTQEKRLRHRCFPVNFAKFIRIPFSIEHIPHFLLEEACITPLKCVIFYVTELRKVNIFQIMINLIKSNDDPLFLTFILSSEKRKRSRRKLCENS